MGTVPTVTRPADSFLSKIPLCPSREIHAKMALTSIGWDCKTMPWKKGISGNPMGNPGKDKLFRTALLMELKSKGEDMPELRQIARTCIDLAVEGEPWAIKGIADRLDGKASIVV